MSRFSPTVTPYAGPDFQSLLGEALGAIRQHQMDTQAKQDRQRQMERQAKQDAAAAEDRDYQRFGRERAMEQAGYTFDRPDPGPATPPPNIFAGQKFGMARRGPAMPPFVPRAAAWAALRRAVASPCRCARTGATRWLRGSRGRGSAPSARRAPSTLQPAPSRRPATCGARRPRSPSPRSAAAASTRSPATRAPSRRRPSTRASWRAGSSRCPAARHPRRLRGRHRRARRDEPGAREGAALAAGRNENAFSVHGRHFSDLGQALEAERAFANAGARQGLTPGEQLSAARLSDQRAERSREQTLSEAEGNAATWAGAGVPQGQISQFLRAQHGLSPGEANRVAAEAVASAGKQGPSAAAPDKARDERRSGIVSQLGKPVSRVQQLIVEDLADGKTPDQVLQAMKAHGAPESDIEAAQTYMLVLGGG